MINATKLTKLYDGSHGVRNIDIDIKSGTAFGFLGKNGAGKTTTIRMLIGLLKPDTGTASVAGYDIISEPDRVRATIGYLPESFGLYEYMTVNDILDYTGRLYGMKASLRKERIDMLLRDVELSDSKNVKAGRLSRGMRQRLGLTRALINDPEVLFLDEPASGLDPVAARDVEALLSGLKEDGKTLFITSHNMAEVQRVCDRIAILKDGNVIASGTVSDVISSYSEINLEEAYIKAMEA